MSEHSHPSTPVDNSYLDWISNDELKRIITLRFSKIVNNLRSSVATQHGPEPTLALTRMMMFDESYDAELKFEALVAKTKSIQNAVGLFHQDVLSSAHGWKPMGASGGGYDLESIDQVQLADNKKVIAEVKMRYNTIKASAEPAVFDKLAEAVKHKGGKRECRAYLFQIVPKTLISYDRPWDVSGRTRLDHVRVIDGVSAYHLVTGKPSALFDLLHIFPTLFNEVFAHSLPHTISLPGKDIIDSLACGSLPKNSVYINHTEH